MTELVAWLEHHHIDILHTHSFRPNLYARMAGAVLKPAGLKIVAHYHNDYADKWQGDALTIERRLGAVTDAALSVSRAIALHVRDLTGTRATVLQNGIDFDRVMGGDRDAGRVALGVPTGMRAVGLVGRLCRQKGADIFVEAAALLHGRFPDVQFVIVGDVEDPALKEHLSTRIARLKLADRVTFAGHWNGMADCYAALDLLAAPSRWEGFGLVLAEAMAAGVPVVASAVGGIPEVVGKAGALVPPENSEALAASIGDVLANPAKAASMSTAGRQESGRFDWARSADRLSDIYLSLGPRQ